MRRIGTADAVTAGPVATVRAMRRLTFPSLVALLLALAALVAACGGDSDDAERADATVPRTTQPRAPKRSAATTPTVTATTPTTTVTTPRPATTPAPQTTPAEPPASRPRSGGAEPRDVARPTDGQGGGAAAPAACGDVANGFLSGVQATGAGCGEATAVARAWLDAVGETGPEAAVEAAGYACTGTRAGDHTDVTCIANRGARVTFAANN